MGNFLTDSFKYKILLASNSPRRKELLEMLNIDFKIVSGIEVDESYPQYLQPEEVPSFLSRKKSEAYHSILSENQMIVTADTIVILDGEILGKPTSTDNAKTMLRKLSGRTHKVVTGVTLSTLQKTFTFSISTAVEFAPLSNEVKELLPRHGIAGTPTLQRTTTILIRLLL